MKWIKMFDYVAFFNGKQIDIKAESSYKAQLKAIDIFKPAKSKKHMVHVMIANVLHVASF